MAAIEMSSARSLLKDRLDTIGGLTNYAQPPAAVPAPPFTVLQNGVIDFGKDMGGGREFSFRLFIAVAEKDAQNGYAELDNYLASSGTKSLKAAVEGNSDGAPKVTDYADLYRFENVGWIVWRGRTFIGAEALIRIPSGG